MLSVPESEAMVLGGVLSGTTDLDDVLEVVNPDEFTPGAYKTIFETIKALYEKGVPVDLVTINDNAVRRFDVTVLAQLTESAASKQSALHHARMVKDASIRRVVAEEGEGLIRAARSGVDPSILVEQATSALSGIATASSDVGSGEITDVIQRLWNNTTSRAENPTTCAGFSTGYQQLDRLLGGWMPKKLYLVAGRPGMGKTAFVLNSIYRGRNASQIFSIEMDDEELVGRIVCFDQHINTLAVRDGRLTDEQYERFGEGCQAVNESGIRIDDSPVITVEEIKARSRIAVKKHGCKIIAVDHCGLVKATDNKASTAEKIGHVSWQLKTLARELKVPVILLSQLNRGVEQRTDKRPILSDLRDSGSLEQDADVVIMLYNASYYAQGKSYTAGQKSITEVITRKHRGGPVGTIPLDFLPEFTALEEIKNG